MPCSGELELVSCRPNLLFNHEGSGPLIVELLGGAVHFQDPGVQPDHVSLRVFATWTLPCIITFFHCHCRLLHHLSGCSSGLCELSHPFICCRVHLRRWSHSTIPRVSSIFKEEGSLSCR